MQEIQIIREKIAQAELVLVGIGEKFVLKNNEAALKAAYANLAALLKEKNYFVISTCEDELICGADLKKDRIVRPLVSEEGWENYMQWLQGTLHKKLLVLELGVGLKYPNVIRFPFEKAAYYNQKADFVRVHDKLFQLPEELSGRGCSVAHDPIALLTEDKNDAS